MAWTIRFGFLLGFVLVLAEVAAAAPAGASSLIETHPALPVFFEKNTGQFPAGYDFVVRGAGGKVGVSAAGLTFAREPGDIAPPLRIRFGAPQRNTLPYTKSPVPTRTHSIDARSAGHSRGAENFLRVGYRSVLPGIDIEYYGNANRLEYDFMVEAGALTEDLHLRIDGASVVELDAQGNLRLERAGRAVLQRPPSVYQGEGAGVKSLRLRFGSAVTSPVEVRF